MKGKKMKRLVLVGLLYFLAGCFSSPSDPFVSNFKKYGVAPPTYTPTYTPTPALPLGMHQVIFEVTGYNSDAAINYSIKNSSHGSGGSIPHATMPWRKSVVVASGMSLFLDASETSADGTNRWVRVVIFVDGISRGTGVNMSSGAHAYGYVNYFIP
jgi:hypothetical protein